MKRNELIALILALLTCLSLTACNAPAASTETTAPYDTETTAPHDTETTAPHDTETTAPHDTETTAPHDTETTAPHDTETTAPQNEESTAPKAEEPEPFVGSLNLEYQLNADQTAYCVVGIGSCTDTDVVIPAEYNGLPITAIGDFAFDGCSRLTDIKIPDSVTEIGEWAFRGCSALTYRQYDNAYYLGSNENPYMILVKAISASISSCTVHESTRQIHSGAFIGRDTLTKIVIPDAVTVIGQQAFNRCAALTSVTIGDGVRSIGSVAFAGCKALTEIVIPDGVTVIGASAFDGCAELTAVTLPDGITGIGYGTFYNCPKLASIVLPDGVTSIGSEAFWGCKRLTNVTIPDSMASIGEGAFNGCTALASIYYSGTESDWSRIDIAEGNDRLHAATRSPSDESTAP